MFSSDGFLDELKKHVGKKLPGKEETVLLTAVQCMQQWTTPNPAGGGGERS